MYMYRCTGVDNVHVHACTCMFLNMMYMQNKLEESEKRFEASKSDLERLADVTSKLAEMEKSYKALEDNKEVRNFLLTKHQHLQLHMCILHTCTYTFVDMYMYHTCIIQCAYITCIHVII